MDEIAEQGFAAHWKYKEGYEITEDEGDDFKRRFVEMLAELEPEDWKLLERMAEKLQKKEAKKS
jgi:GTP pyrophosphokinase